MESFRGFELPCVCAGDEKGSLTGDTEWDMEEHQLSDRGPVSTLLDVSEECLDKDQDADAFGDHTGWEEAVHGWGRGPSLICLLQTQRRGKKPKSWDADSHCLLCVETKVAEPHASVTVRHSLEFCSGSSDKTTKKKFLNKVDFLKTRPSSTGFNIFSDRNASEVLSKQNVLAKKFPGVGGLLINSTAATCIGLPHHQEDQCPMLNDRCTGNVTLINCFAVLPPLRASLGGNVSSLHHLKREDVTLGANEQGVVKMLQGGASAMAGGSGGVDGSGEMRTEANLDSRSAEDGSHSSSASKYWTFQNDHRLLTAFSLPITKRSDQTYSTVDDAIPRGTSRMGRYLRQEDLTRPTVRNNSGNKLCFGYKTKNIRRTEPVLPRLFGTRVAIPASAHRL